MGSRRKSNGGGVRPSRSTIRHAATVAAVATAIIAAIFGVATVVVDAVGFHLLDTRVDHRLSTQLGEGLRRIEATGTSVTASGALGSDDTDDDVDGVPLASWLVDGSGHVLATTPGAPRLNGEAPPRAGLATATLGATPYRLDVAGVNGSWLVVGQSLAAVHHIQSVLVTAEALIAPVLLAAVFLVALAIGLRAVAPVEASRRRQLEFTADASHELRTPLSVIEAEVDVTRSVARPTAEYEAALDRIGHESHRLRRIVEDLLWLARLDQAPPAPPREPVELGTLAQSCARRFNAIARSRAVTIAVDLDADAPVSVEAPAYWVDRLVGVLVDNACRFAPDHGHVWVTVATRGNRALLVVEDDGPGIPEEAKDRILDRFHRAGDGPGGHGLGLAIADSVVHATGGRWRIGNRPSGGARFEVSWPKG